MGNSERGSEIIPKPDELLALHSISKRLFETLREWFAIGREVTIDLQEIDSAVIELSSPEMIMAMAMRKLQALHLLSTPGVLTSTDVVIAIVNDLDRALLQAPSMYLEREAGMTNWDLAFAKMGDDKAHPEDIPTIASEPDPVIEEFQVHHEALHHAVRAVVEASDGEIRYFQ
ncbi:MAG: hypothetical protein VYB80_05105 [Actinomycetota bacterium]|nr:hypothetical protein [Actinomycetota bacterium]